MQDLENLKTAAVQAGKIALGYFDKHYKTWDKEAGAGPVTEADLEIDDFLKTSNEKTSRLAKWLRSTLIDLW